MQAPAVTRWLPWFLRKYKSTSPVAPSYLLFLQVTNTSKPLQMLSLLKLLMSSKLFPSWNDPQIIILLIPIQGVSEKSTVQWFKPPKHKERKTHLSLPLFYIIQTISSSHPPHDSTWSTSSPLSNVNNMLHATHSLSYSSLYCVSKQ